jgi:hypothetical protein
MDKELINIHVFGVRFFLKFIFVTHAFNGLYILIV